MFYLMGNFTNKPSNSSMKYFIILKYFEVKIKPPKPLSIFDVFWKPTLTCWIKVNSGGAILGVPIVCACSGMLRNSSSEHWGSFWSSIYVGTLFQVSWLMIWLQLRSWLIDFGKYLLLEMDSKNVFHAFTIFSIVLWHLRNRCTKYAFNTLSMNFIVTHIYLKDNKCGNKFFGMWLISSHFHWFDYLPCSLKGAFLANKHGFPCLDIETLKWLGDCPPLVLPFCSFPF